MQLIDTHCHLDAAEFDADRDALVREAGAAQVAAIVVPAVERANFDAVEAVARRHPRCVFALGIHPLYVDRAREADVDALAARLREGGAVAVGEIGLDFFHEGADRPAQERLFALQLEVARAAGLPVLLHVRRAQDAVLKHLRRARVAGGIAHAFNGSRQQAEAFIKLGFKLGFGGAMTYERALRIRDLAAQLPLEAIVLETDAPDMAPAWIARGRNTPTQLPRIAQVLAQLRGIAVEEVARATSANTCAALPGLAAALPALAGPGSASAY